MDGRSSIPSSGFVVRAVIDGNAVLLGDPLSAELVDAIAARGPLVELWAYWRTEVGNIALLRGFPELQRLHIINRTQDNLGGLSELKGLRTLTIESDKVFHVDMSFWPELEELVFTWSGRFQNLDKATKLAVLRVWSWKEKDLARASSMPQLRVLELVRGRIRSLRGIEGCRELEKLSLSYLSKLADFDALGDLRSLRVLNIDTCRGLASLDCLAALPRLQSLSLDNLGNIPSLAPLSSSRLRRLSFSGTTNIEDGDTDIVNRIPVVDYAFRNRKHYNYNYNHRKTRAERERERA